MIIPIWHAFGIDEGQVKKLHRIRSQAVPRSRHHQRQGRVEGSLVHDSRIVVLRWCRAATEHR